MRATHDYTLHTTVCWLARHWPRWAFPPGVRLALLSRLQPVFIVAPTQADRVVACIRYVRDCIGPRGDDTPSASDDQAVAAYRRGILAALVEPKGAMPPRPLIALPGSRWSDFQLRQLDLLGYQHGTFIRYATTGVAGVPRPDIGSPPSVRATRNGQAAPSVGDPPAPRSPSPGETQPLGP